MVAIDNEYCMDGAQEFTVENLGEVAIIPPISGGWVQLWPACQQPICSECSVPFAPCFDYEFDLIIKLRKNFHCKIEKLMEEEILHN